MNIDSFWQVTASNYYDKRRDENQYVFKKDETSETKACDVLSSRYFTSLISLLLRLGKELKRVLREYMHTGWKLPNLNQS